MLEVAGEEFSKADLLESKKIGVADAIIIEQTHIAIDEGNARTVGELAEGLSQNLSEGFGVDKDVAKEAIIEQFAERGHSADKELGDIEWGVRHGLPQAATREMLIEVIENDPKASGYLMSETPHDVAFAEISDFTSVHPDNIDARAEDYTRSVVANALDTEMMMNIEARMESVEHSTTFGDMNEIVARVMHNHDIGNVDDIKAVLDNGYTEKQLNEPFSLGNGDPHVGKESYADKVVDALSDIVKESGMVSEDKAVYEKIDWVQDHIAFTTGNIPETVGEYKAQLADVLPHLVEGSDGEVVKENLDKTFADYSDNTPLSEIRKIDVDSMTDKALLEQVKEFGIDKGQEVDALSVEEAVESKIDSRFDGDLSAFPAENMSLEDRAEWTLNKAAVSAQHNLIVDGDTVHYSKEANVGMMNEEVGKILTENGYDGDKVREVLDKHFAEMAEKKKDLVQDYTSVTIRFDDSIVEGKNIDYSNPPESTSPDGEKWYGNLDWYKEEVNNIARDTIKENIAEQSPEMAKAYEAEQNREGLIEFIKSSSIVAGAASAAGYIISKLSGGDKEQEKEVDSPEVSSSTAQNIIASKNAGGNNKDDIRSR